MLDTIFGLWYFAFTTIRTLLYRLNPLKFFGLLPAAEGDIGSAAKRRDDDKSRDVLPVTSSGIDARERDAPPRSRGLAMPSPSPSPPPSSPSSSSDTEQPPIVDPSSRAYDLSDVKDEMEKPDVTVSEIKRMMQRFDYVKEVQEGALDRLTAMTHAEGDVAAHNLVKLVVTIMKCYRRRASIQSKACKLLRRLADVSDEVKEEVKRSGVIFEATRAKDAFPSDAVLEEEVTALLDKLDRNPLRSRTRSLAESNSPKSPLMGFGKSKSLAGKSRSLGL